MGVPAALEAVAIGAFVVEGFPVFTFGVVASLQAVGVVAISLMPDAGT